MKNKLKLVQRSVFRTVNGTGMWIGGDECLDKDLSLPQSHRGATWCYIPPLRTVVHGRFSSRSYRYSERLTRWRGETEVTKGCFLCIARYNKCSKPELEGCVVFFVVAILFICCFNISHLHRNGEKSHL